MLTPTLEVMGQLIEARTNHPMAGYAVITETGIRDESSPLCTVSVGPVAVTDSEGRFLSTSRIRGPSAPATIEIHIEIKRGEWRCFVCAVLAHMVRHGPEETFYIRLGQVKVEVAEGRVPLR